MELLKEIAEFLSDGAIDYREVEDVFSKFDQADVHVPGNTKTSAAGKKRKKKDEKWAKRIAFTTNAIGVVAAPAAISAALRDPRLRSSTSDKKARKAKGIPLKVASKTGLKRFANNRKVLTAGAVGAVGLQVGNAAGDAISAKYFGSEMRKKKKDKVKKSLDDVLDARRSGAIGTDDAVDIVSKFMSEKFERKFNRAERVAIMNRQGKMATMKGKHMVLIGTGLLAAGGGGAAIHAANKNGINYQRPSVYTPVLTTREKIGKSDDLEWAGTVSKVDTDKRQVFGWCSLTKVNGEDVVDRQGDYIPLDEVEKSAYNYVIHSRKGGDMHKRDGEAPLHTSDLIESFVVTPEKLQSLGLEPDAVPHGWWVGFKVNDDNQWEAVKKGERAHFSIHGKGRRREVHK